MKIDHIHFYVEDAAQTRDWFIQKMGFQSYGQQINAHTCTEIVGRSSILFLVSSALSPESPVTRYLTCHPSGVVDVAFLVDNLASFSEKIARLEVQVLEPQGLDQGLDSRNLQQMTIQGWGNFHHTLIESPVIKGPHDQDAIAPAIDQAVQNMSIDHVVLNVEQHQLAAATSWYQALFDLQVQQSFEIQTDYSGLSSHALIDATGQVQFNINEPSTPNSQIQTFLEIHGGAGIQHIALRTDNIVQSVLQMQAQDLAFLTIPASYYTHLKQRSQQMDQFPLTAQDWQDLVQADILLDWSEEDTSGLLMQIFTQPIFEQPTFFFELIERRGRVRGFGEGNFLALFQAMERFD